MAEPNDAANVVGADEAGDGNKGKHTSQDKGTQVMLLNRELHGFSDYKMRPKLQEDECDKNLLSEGHVPQRKPNSLTEKSTAHAIIDPCEKAIAKNSFQDEKTDCMHALRKSNFPIHAGIPFKERLSGSSRPTAASAIAFLEQLEELLKTNQREAFELEQILKSLRVHHSQFGTPLGHPQMPRAEMMLERHLERIKPTDTQCDRKEAPGDLEKCTHGSGVATSSPAKAKPMDSIANLSEQSQTSIRSRSKSTSTITKTPAPQSKQSARAKPRSKSDTIPANASHQPEQSQRDLDDVFRFSHGGKGSEAFQTACKATNSELDLPDKSKRSTNNQDKLAKSTKGIFRPVLWDKPLRIDTRAGVGLPPPCFGFSNLSTYPSYDQNSGYYQPYSEERHLQLPSGPNPGRYISPYAESRDPVERPFHPKTSHSGPQPSRSPFSNTNNSRSASTCHTPAPIPASGSCEPGPTALLHSPGSSEFGDDFTSTRPELLPVQDSHPIRVRIPVPRIAIYRPPSPDAPESPGGTTQRAGEWFWIPDISQYPSRIPESAEFFT